MGALTAVGSPAERPRIGWISSASWDLFWMFSALWGAAVLLSGGLFVEVTLLAGLLFLANRFVSIAHAWSTTYMVLFSPLMQSERRANRGKYVYLPALIVIGSFALGIAIGGWQRFPENGRLHAGLWAFVLYIGLFWVGHFWHFGNQDFGVLTIYRMKAAQLRPLDRKVDKLYTVAMMFVIQPIVYLSIVKTTAFAEIAYTWLPIDTRGVALAAGLCVAVAAVLSVGAVAFELSKPNRSLPKLLYYLVIFLHPLLLFGAGWAREPILAFLYLMAYMWSHWFIAIGLVARINSRYHQTRGDSGARSWLRHALTLGSIAGAAWLVTYNYVDFGLFNTDEFEYKEMLASIGPGETLIIGLVLGFFLAEQLLHYYCDRCLFRFRDAGVRKKVAPLLL